MGRLAAQLISFLYEIMYLHFSVFISSSVFGIVIEFMTGTYFSLDNTHSHSYWQALFIFDRSALIENLYQFLNKARMSR